MTAQTLLDMVIAVQLKNNKSRDDPQEVVDLMNLAWIELHKRMLLRIGRAYMEFDSVPQVQSIDIPNYSGVMLNIVDNLEGDLNLVCHNESRYAIDEVNSNVKLSMLNFGSVAGIVDVDTASGQIINHINAGNSLILQFDYKAMPEPITVATLGTYIIPDIYANAIVLHVGYTVNHKLAHTVREGQYVARYDRYFEDEMTHLMDAGAYIKYKPSNRYDYAFRKFP